MYQAFTEGIKSPVPPHRHVAPPPPTAARGPLRGAAWGGGFAGILDVCPANQCDVGHLRRPMRPSGCLEQMGETGWFRGFDPPRRTWNGRSTDRGTGLRWMIKVTPVSDPQGALESDPSRSINHSIFGHCRTAMFC